MRKKTKYVIVCVIASFIWISVNLLIRYYQNNESLNLEKESLSYLIVPMVGSITAYGYYFFRKQKP